MLENIDDGILEQPPEDSGFKPAQDSSESCRSCVHYSARYCDLWNAKTRPTMTCEAWDDFSDFKMAMSDMDYEPIENENDEEGLSDRQEAMYEVYEQIARTFGKWDASIGANGAHYVEKSPFEKMNCANCVFFRESGICEIVEGEIAPEGICKLWIIPEHLLSESE